MENYKQLIPEITLKFKKGAGIHMVKIGNSKDAFELFKKLYDEDTIELCETSIALFLNRANKSIGWFKVSQGGINCTVVDIKLVLATALKCGASTIMLSHNHPSGNLSPSNDDINLTKNLKAACTFLDMNFIDHIIVNDTLNKYYSFADEGEI